MQTLSQASPTFRRLTPTFPVDKCCVTFTPLRVSHDSRPAPSQHRLFTAVPIQTLARPPQHCLSTAVPIQTPTHPQHPLFTAVPIQTPAHPPQHRLFTAVRPNERPAPNAEPPSPPPAGQTGRLVA